MTEIIIPGKEYHMKMSLAAFRKIAEYVIDNIDQMKPGDKFTIQGTDKKELKILLEK